MNDEIMQGAQISSTQLEEEAERRYVDRLLGILRTGRLNLHYPESRRLQSHIEAMHPDVHRGLYDGISVNLDSGLPTYQEWTRVQTDVDIADEQLSQLGNRKTLERKAKSDDPSIHDKMLKKHDYYSEIRDTQLSPLGEMDVQLRRVDTDNNRAYFHVVLDKLDASGLFVRFSIELAQESSAWSEQVVQLDEETAEHTEEFQSLVYRFTSLDAEFTFAKLAGIGGLDVEMVAKGTVGPIYLAAEQAPENLQPLFEQTDDGFLATFSLDKVGGDIAETRDNDPLDSLITERLSTEARRVYEKARERYDYRAFKDRKFVVPPDLVEPVRNFCNDRGTKNIVYPLRER
jgi:hypothetical protein